MKPTPALTLETPRFAWHQTSAYRAVLRNDGEGTLLGLNNGSPRCRPMLLVTDVETGQLRRFGVLRDDAEGRFYELAPGAESVDEHVLAERTGLLAPGRYRVAAEFFWNELAPEEGRRRKS